ncbi:uncharacterized protein LOC119870518 [Canis lupus familiaris]|uniref:uncharacterized protein LOC119870518 n=1 Tax=Canis lupus familiaris TaxID=9615 RepID=UPI0018F789B1|nr:uncharacterized protein LOC119870518 [Canis lupus familiaris]
MPALSPRPGGQAPPSPPTRRRARAPRRGPRRGRAPRCAGRALESEAADGSAGPVWGAWGEAAPPTAQLSGGQQRARGERAGRLRSALLEQMRRCRSESRVRSPKPRARGGEKRPLEPLLPRAVPWLPGFDATQMDLPPAETWDQRRKVHGPLARAPAPTGAAVCIRANAPRSQRDPRILPDAQEPLGVYAEQDTASFLSQLPEMTEGKGDGPQDTSQRASWTGQSIHQLLH